MLIGLAGKRTQHIPSPRMEQHTVKKMKKNEVRNKSVFIANAWNSTLEK
jgi:hypothetical protein